MKRLSDLDICHHGDALDVLRRLPDECVQCCVTSPPYWGLRDYGIAGQLGLEATPEEYVASMVDVFSDVRRVLADDGTLWLNLGDSYNSNSDLTRNDEIAARGLCEQDRLIRPVTPGLKRKDLVGIPWRIAFALQADGWYLRQDIIWAKPNPMPESVTDRCTKAHEYLFLLSKRDRYHYDAEAIEEKANPLTQRGTNAPNARDVGDGIGMKYSDFERQRYKTERRNRRSVWTIPSEPFPDAHFATFPRALVELCILAGSRPGDVVLDPFLGSGTTAQVAQDLGRRWIGVELNSEYIEMQRKRTAQGVLEFHGTPTPTQ